MIVSILGAMSSLTSVAGFSMVYEMLIIPLLQTTNTPEEVEHNPLVVALVVVGVIVLIVLYMRFREKLKI